MICAIVTHKRSAATGALFLKNCPIFIVDLKLSLKLSPVFTQIPPLAFCWMYLLFYGALQFCSFPSFT